MLGFTLEQRKQKGFVWSGAGLRTYLVRADLMVSPRVDSGWQALYRNQNDRAFITTMGVNIGLNSTCSNTLQNHSVARYARTTESSQEYGLILDGPDNSFY